MRRFIIFLISILVINNLHAEETKENENQKTYKDSKIATFKLYFNGDYWAYSLFSKNKDTNDIYFPKSEVNGFRYYVNLKVNLKDLITLEKSLTFSTYDYFSIYPSGWIGTLIGFISYDIDQNNLKFKKYWFGLLSGAVAYENVKYERTIEGKLYKVEKQKYGVLLGEGLKIWFDFLSSINWSLIKDEYNFLLILPAGDFYYVKSKYKNSADNIDATGYGMSFGFKFAYIHQFKNRFSIGLQGRYVFGFEDLSYDKNNREYKITDEFQDYYIRVYFTYKFSL